MIFISVWRSFSVSIAQSINLPLILIYLSIHLNLPSFFFKTSISSHGRSPVHFEFLSLFFPIRNLTFKSSVYFSVCNQSPCPMNGKAFLPVTLKSVILSVSILYSWITPTQGLDLSIFVSLSPTHSQVLPHWLAIKATNAWSMINIVWNLFLTFMSLLCPTRKRFVI